MAYTNAPILLQNAGSPAGWRVRNPLTRASIGAFQGVDASLEETLQILSNPTLRDAIREGEADLASGRTERLTKDEALARISKR